jgi:hypothetical protein
MRLSFPYSNFLKWLYANMILVIALTCIFACALVFADAPGNGDFGTWIGEAMGDAAVWKVSGAAAIAAMLVKLIADFVNVNFVYAWVGKLSPTVQLIIVHGLAALTAGTAVLVGKGTWLQALGATFIAAGGAVYLDQLLSNVFGLNISFTPVVPASSGAANPPAVSS